MDTTKKDYSVEKNASGSETLADIDGNVYKTVEIGKQIWMAENLKVTRYRNGDEIPNVKDCSAWAGLSSGARCAYDDREYKADVYGYLYNWYAVSDGRKIAPSGWHMPTDEEWQTLVDYLGGENVAGGKMKETGTSHWKRLNTGATNVSGFSGLPGGYLSDGSFYYLGIDASFWSATEYGADIAWSRYLCYGNSRVYRQSCIKLNGFSVRLLRDN